MRGHGGLSRAARPADQSPVGGPAVPPLTVLHTARQQEFTRFGICRTDKNRACSHTICSMPSSNTLAKRISTT